MEHCVGARQPRHDRGITSRPRGEGQVLRLFLVVDRGKQLDRMRMVDAAYTPAHAEHGEHRVRCEEVLLLPLDVALGDEVDVLTADYSRVQ